MNPETERIIKNLNSTADIRKAFSMHKDLEKKLIDSLEPAKSLVETILTRLSLKDKKFKIFSAATDNEIENLKKSLSVFDKNINSLESSVDLKKFPKFYNFFKSHCNCRTYIFQIRKCIDPLCPFHKPMRGSKEIQSFPGPIPVEVEDGLQHSEGLDENGKFLPSKLQDVEK